MKLLESTSVNVTDAGFNLTRGANTALAIAVPSNAELDDAVDALGRARWCERGPHREPEDLDHLGSIDPTDFAAEWPWIGERFRYFYERPYEQAEAAANEVEAALGELRASNMSVLGSARTSIADWSGDAKDAKVALGIVAVVVGAITAFETGGTSFQIALGCSGPASAGRRPRSTPPRPLRGTRPARSWRRSQRR